jgi:acyl-CoA synthetase (AMP-forming)/AMP-acid ligase II/3-hydroxymyristoyl/3-hydroxydecanoyl-(acyl carrier protein) dehydratase
MAELTPLAQWLQHQPRQAVAWDSAGELDSQQFVARVSAWIATLAPLPGQRFALHHDDSAEFLAILLALWQLQRIACIASDNQPGSVAQLQHQVDGFIGDFPALANPVRNPRNDAAAFCDWQQLEADRVLLEIHTSGSSGAPKTIAKTVTQLDRELAALQARWPGEADSRLLSTVSHHHFYGLMIALLWPFSAGRCFARRICEFPEDIICRGALLPGFTLVSSPSHLARFSPAFDWSAVAGRCEAAYSSAAPLRRADSQNASLLLQAPVREIYGSSETGAIAWRCQQQTDLDAAWSALPGVRLGATEQNTLAIQAPYLDVDRLELPDRVEFDAAGCFRLLGRVDRIVKVEGKRISLSLLENLLCASDLVDEARAVTLERVRVEVAVVLQLSETGQAQLLQTGRKTLIQQLRKLLDGELQTVAMPRRWRFVEQMPRNTEGKLPLQKLQALFATADNRWPQILERKLDNAGLTLRCRIPPGLEYFDGHMLNRPILPGIAQVHWAEAFGRRWLPIVGRFHRLEVVKFQKVILPEYEVEIRLDFDVDSSKLNFCFKSERGVHSRGRICFR